MITGIATVIAVAWRDVKVVGVKTDRTETDACIQRPFLTELPGGLQIGIKIPHQVTFVAPHISLLTELRHAVGRSEILKTFALFAHGFVIQPGSQRDRNRKQIITVCPAGINALIVAGQRDHAAGMRWASLHVGRNGLELRRFTHPGIHHHAQVVVFAHPTLIVQAALGLIDGFAGVVK